jgi:hypothetical protein
VEDATVSVLEWVAAVGLVIGSGAVLWLVRAFDLATAERPRPRLVWRRASEPRYRKAA